MDCFVLIPVNKLSLNSIYLSLSFELFYTFDFVLFFVVLFKNQSIQIFVEITMNDDIYIDFISTCNRISSIDRLIIYLKGHENVIWFDSNQFDLKPSLDLLLFLLIQFKSI